MKTIAWSRYTAICADCNRRFRVDLEALAIARTQGGPEEECLSDRDLVGSIEFCMECTAGLSDTGEFIADNPHARRWDPKGWALDTLAAMARELIAHFDQGARDGDPETAELRLRRRAFVAQALRDRIDGIV